MESILNVLGKSGSGIVANSDKIKKIYLPFSENDAIYLQKIFVTPGFHHIKFEDEKAVNFFINKILKSLKCHHDIAYLGKGNTLFDVQVVNIYKELNGKANLDLTDFFLDDFYFDLLLIEYSKSLESEGWLCKFEQQLLDFNFNKLIPIIVFTT